MRMKEEAISFGRAIRLVGVVTDPPEAQSGPGAPAVLLLNSGMVHRIGPNRIYVKMARALAQMGFVVLRLDFSGIGDSGTRRDTLPFAKYAVDEAQEAMDWLAAHRGTSRFILAGICSGALMTLKVASCDPRVVGALSVNLAGHRSGAGADEARTMARHYRRIAFSSSFSSKTLLKVIVGNVNRRRLVQTARALATNLFVRKKSAGAGGASENSIAGLFRKLIERGVAVGLIHSEGDEGLDYMHLVLGKELRRWISEGSVEFHLIPGANHTFTLLANQEEFLKHVKQWAQGVQSRMGKPLESCAGGAASS